jgi:hypothetical protein
VQQSAKLALQFDQTRPLFAAQLDQHDERRYRDRKNEQSADDDKEYGFVHEWPLGWLNHRAGEWQNANRHILPASGGLFQQISRRMYFYRVNAAGDAKEGREVKTIIDDGCLSVGFICAFARGRLTITTDSLIAPPTASREKKHD